MSRKSAADIVARELLVKRVRVGGRGNAARTVEQWRDEAADAHGRTPVHDAYRQVYAQLRSHFRRGAPSSNADALKKAVAYGLAQGFFDF